MQPSKLALLSVAVSSAMALSACSNGLNFSKNKGLPNTSPVDNTLETIVKEDVKIISNQINQEVKNVRTNGNKQMVITTNENSQLSSQKVGDIVFLPPKNTKDSGIFVKIDEIKTNAKGELEFITSQPKIEEVFEKVNANIENAPLQVIEIIAPNALSTPNAQKQAMQVGLEKSGRELDYSTKISLSLHYPKVGKSHPNYELHSRFCAYPIREARHSFNIDPKTQEKLLEDKIEELCKKSFFKLEGTLGIIYGKYTDSLVADQTIDGLILSKEKNGELGLKGTKIFTDLTFTAEKQGKLSDFDIVKKIYAEQFFKDYEEVGVKSWIGHASITGLSVDDKSGKIPVLGFVLGVPTVGIPQPFTILDGPLVGKTKIDSVASAGIVAMIYAVLDAQGEVKFEIKYIYESELMNFGYQVKDGEISLLDKNTTHEESKTLSIGGDLKAEINLGATLEADFLLGGLRFANIGGGYLANPNLEINGEARYEFTKQQFDYSGCASIGMGHGFLSFGQLAIGVDAGLNLGYFRPSIKKGVKYEFRFPSEEEQKDPTFKSPLWQYKDWGRICLTNIPADFTPNLKVLKPSLNMVGAVTTVQGATVDINVDVPIKDKDDNFHTTIKEWKLEITEANSNIDVGHDKLVWQKPIDVTVDQNGNLKRKGVISQLAPIIVPYGGAMLRLTATDYKGNKVDKYIKVNEKNPLQIDTKVMAISTNPNKLTTEQDFDLTISGVALGSDSMFNVEGCYNQQKVNISAVQHIYKCTAPAKATNNHNIAVFDTKGNKLFEKNFKVEQLVSNIVLSNTNLSVGDKIKLTISNLANSIKSVIWNIGGAISNVVDNIANGVEHRFDKEGDVAISATLKDDKNQTVQELTSKVTVAPVAVPTVLIKPDNPKQGQDFIAVLNNDGNKEKVVKAVWEYDGKTKTVAQADLYKDVTINSNKDELLLKISFYDIYNNLLGITQKSVKLDKQSVPVPPITPTATKLTATGITLCGDTTRNNVKCSLLQNDWIGLMQDGEVQAGQKMSYTVLNQNGAECVRDNVTGLIWEQKTDDGGLRDKDNTYTWYNPDNRTNGGNAGSENGGKNTYEYIKQLNASNYCGYSDWRMPTIDELTSIVDYGRFNPAIDPIFSNTQRSFYWSNSPNADNNTYEWGVNFEDGWNRRSNKKFSSSYVRAVR